jgi:hypothetical protein
VTVGAAAARKEAAAEGAANVAPSPVPGQAVNGLKLTLSADRTFLAMTPRELLRATKDSPRWNVELTKLTFTFTNMGDKPIKLDAFDLVWSRMKLDVTGPDGDSVRVMMRKVMREWSAPEAKHYPTIAPGETWECPDRMRFPGGFGGNEYVLLKPGEYRVKATYSVPELRDGSNAVTVLTSGIWRGTVASNELVLAAVVPGEPVNGLKMTITADKAELRMTPRQEEQFAKEPKPYDVAPAEVKISFTNVSDKPIKVNVCDLVMTGLRPDVVGPTEKGVRIFTQRLLRNHMAVAGPQDFPTIEAGETWTSRETCSFPYDQYQWVVRLMTPGEFRLRLVYAKETPELAKNAFAFTAGAWAGTLMSNELVFTGVEAKDAK